MKSFKIQNELEMVLKFEGKLIDVIFSEAIRKKMNHLVKDLTLNECGVGFRNNGCPQLIHKDTNKWTSVTHCEDGKFTFQIFKRYLDLVEVP
jgi:hypothetical protein